GPWFLLFAGLCSGRSELLAVAWPRRARQPEVEHARSVVLTDPDVFRFEVTVKDSPRMRRREAPACLCEHAHDFGPRSWAIGEPIGERAPLDVLHGNEDLVPERPDVVD